MRIRHFFPAFLVVSAVSVPVLYFLFWLPQTIEYQSGKMSHGVYVWQRQWDNAVLSALERSDSTVSAFIVLAAEVSWKGRMPNVVKVVLDYQTLQSIKSPIGLALRIGPFEGKESEYKQHAVFLAELSESIIREANEHGVEVAELQVDFDAAESKLVAYRTWLETIRKVVGSVPLTITALPSWMNRDSFTALVKATDGYVLQVHSLERPKTIGEEISICQADRAKQWVRQASRVGVPFRVALPTYGYLLIADQKGRFVGLSAEGPSLDRDEKSRYISARSDPFAMQNLVQDWSRSRPGPMQGIIWYRLPVESDSLNWKWRTLKKIVAGEKLRSMIDLRVAYQEKELVELSLLNKGDVDEILPKDVVVTWQGGKLIAADGLGGYRVSGLGSMLIQNNIRFSCTANSRLASIEPRKEYKIGWLRFDKEVKIDAKISNPQK